jgi:hypothetical protein
MMSLVKVVAISLLPVAVIGCDSRSTSLSKGAATSHPAAEGTPAPNSDAAVPVQARLPAAAPSSTQPATLPSAFMIIKGQRVDFPPAKLRVSSSDGKVIALLFSDDPKDAISDQYTGHSFYLEMELDVAEPKDYLSAAWHFSADSHDRQDTPYGIFLDGHRRQLQPTDVRVKFEPSPFGSDVTTVWLKGTFLEINIQDPGTPPREAEVSAQFVAKTMVK